MRPRLLAWQGLGRGRRARPVSPAHSAPAVSEEEVRPRSCWWGGHPKDRAGEAHGRADSRGLRRAPTASVTPQRPRVNDSSACWWLPTLPPNYSRPKEPRHPQPTLRGSRQAPRAQHETHGCRARTGCSVTRLDLPAGATLGAHLSPPEAEQFGAHHATRHIRGACSKHL